MTEPAAAPLLTRIVTVYRQWDCVARWIDDPRLADPRVEWIFVDDAFDSPVPAALRETAVGCGARFVADGVNRGRCGARNRGAALASAPWLAHIDGDDLPRPLPAVFPLPEAGLVFLPFATPGGGEAWSEERLDTAVFGELFAEMGVAVPVDWRPAALLWRRESFERIGGYDARFEGAEDAHLVWKALRAGLRTARAEGAGALVEVSEAGPRSELIHLAAGRLRFWETVAASGGATGVIGKRALSYQLPVVFWTARDAATALGGRGMALREGAKIVWNALRGRR